MKCSDVEAPLTSVHSEYEAERMFVIFFSCKNIYIKLHAYVWCVWDLYCPLRFQSM